jgi:hypothetical protein
MLYYFDPATKHYMGSQAGTDSGDSGGNQVIPANATTVAPPELTETQYAVWDGSDWTVEDKPIPPPAPVIDETELNNANIKAQIIALEMTQLRTMREITLGDTDLTRLQAIEDQIVALRAQLI